MVGEHAAAQVTLLAAKHIGPTRIAMRDHQGHAANMGDNSAQPWIPHASSLVPKPLTNLSLILAASSRPLVMVFGRRLYALETHKATCVTHMCTVVYETE